MRHLQGMIDLLPLTAAWQKPHELNAYKCGLRQAPERYRLLYTLHIILFILVNKSNASIRAQIKNKKIFALVFD